MDAVTGVATERRPVGRTAGVIRNGGGAAESSVVVRSTRGADAGRGSARGPAGQSCSCRRNSVVRLGFGEAAGVGVPGGGVTVGS